MRPPPTQVIVHLSGELRGTTRPLSGAKLDIGSAAEAEIRIPVGRAGVLGAHHATLMADGDGYRLAAAAPHRLWINGQPAGDRRLASGDLIELGENGPLLRYRVYRSGRPPFKSMNHAIADCYQCAKKDSDTVLGRTRIFVASVLRHLKTEVSPLTRGATLAAVLLLLAAVAFLAIRGQRMEERLEVETRQVEGLESLLESAGREHVSSEQLEASHRRLEARLSSAAERLDFLEERAGAAQRTVAEASRSVLFLQGSYGFRDAQSRRPLRVALGQDGDPLFDENGTPQFTTEGAGPIVEALFTGTGFVATADGLVVTNRHVALPWEFDQDARQVVAQGLEPFMVRFVGYLADIAEPFDVAVVLASDTADLALLKCSNVTGTVPVLALDRSLPEVGEEVIVMGFPTGIQAMMARADQSFLDEIEGERLDFWSIASRLAAAGQIGPLATRGIIGQVSESSIVYDAETTSGGSGGPVLTLDGRVVAINSAILRQFDGSNLGVPSAQAIELLDQATLAAAGDPDGD